MRRYFAFHDSDKTKPAFAGKPVDPTQLGRLNKEGYGIFYAVNELGGDGHRSADNVVKINAWFCDIDTGTKDEQLKRINDLVILPSFIVESAHGFHCYWVSKDGTLENFKAIEEGLIDALDGDKHCSDVCRVLRVPGYYHQKDPAHPFLVRMYKKFDGKVLNEKTMLLAFKKKEVPTIQLKKENIPFEKKDFFDENKWERIFKISQIGEGGRNNSFARIALWMKDENLSRGENLNLIRGLNSKLLSPLSDVEIRQIVFSKY